MPVLVIFASTHGATREIAERVAQTMTAARQQAQARPVTTAGDLTGYDAFVVGSRRVYGALAEGGGGVRPAQPRCPGRPPGVAVQQRAAGHRAHQRPGPGSDRRGRAPELAEFTEAIHPRGHRIFFGVLDPGSRATRTGAAEAAAARAIMPEGDFRDWAQIEAWARGIARDPALGTGGADGSARTADGQHDARL